MVDAPIGIHKATTSAELKWPYKAVGPIRPLVRGLIRGGLLYRERDGDRKPGGKTLVKCIWKLCD